MDLIQQREILFAKLGALDVPARIRPVHEFSEREDSCFHALSDEREFIVFLVDDVTWGPGLSHYINPKNEWRICDQMVVDAPNELVPYLDEIEILFIKFLAGDV